MNRVILAIAVLLAIPVAAEASQRRPGMPDPRNTVIAEMQNRDHPQVYAEGDDIVRGGFTVVRQRTVVRRVAFAPVAVRAVAIRRVAAFDVVAVNRVFVRRAVVVPVVQQVVIQPPAFATVQQTFSVPVATPVFTLATPVVPVFQAFAFQTFAVHGCCR